MSKSVWKYSLDITDVQTIEMPEDVEILSVQMQKDTLCMWVFIDPAKDLILKTFYIIGTGHLIDNNAITDIEKQYIGTFQTGSGSLVFHVFEEAQ